MYSQIPPEAVGSLCQLVSYVFTVAAMLITLALTARG
jgi:hypothetical protein